MLTLVTGASGQVGRRFVPRLLEQCDPGDEVRVLVRDAAHGAEFARRGAQVAVGDLRDSGSVDKALTGADAVVNLAAAFPGRTPDDEAWEVNRDGALALGRAALASGVTRFVQASTNLVYGPGRGRPLEEDDDLRPDPAWGVYPASKAEAEHGLLAAHRERGLGLRILRLSFVYGEGDPHLAQAMKFVTGWAAHQRLSMVHHADAGQALLRLLWAPGIDGRAYSVSDDAPISAVELHALTGTPVPGQMDSRPLADPWEGMTSNRRIRRELGFRPLYPSVWTALDAGVL